MSAVQSQPTVIIRAPSGFHVVVIDGRERMQKVPVVAFAITGEIARPITAHAHVGTALLTSGGDVIDDQGHVFRNIDEWLEYRRSPCR